MERALFYEASDFMPMPRSGEAIPLECLHIYLDNIEWTSTHPLGFS
jgi:hypothetical protein